MSAPYTPQIAGTAALAAAGKPPEAVATAVLGVQTTLSARDASPEVNLVSRIRGLIAPVTAG